jgi:hypothetical protein
MKSEKDDKGNILKAGAVGAVIGAAAGGAATYLADKRNRKKVGETFSQIRDVTRKAVGRVRQEGEESAKELKQVAKETKESMEEKAKK